jgi:hypothetical protein
MPQYYGIHPAGLELIKRLAPFHSGRSTMGFHRTGLAAISTAAFLIGGQFWGLSAIASPQPVAEAGNKQAAGDSAVILDTSGTLDDSDPTLPDGSYYEEYSFTGRAGQEIVIDMNSPEFDTYLFLLAPDGSFLADNDDISGSNFNSQIRVTLPSNGVYTIAANGYDSSSLGRYNLTVTTALGTGDLQITLSWNSTDDLDLVVMDPDGNLVSFETPSIASGGQLDVDANALCQGVTSSPVENVFWPANGAPGGEYQVLISLYARCANSQGPIPFTLTMNVQGTVETFDGTVDESNDLVVVPTAVY